MPTTETLLLILLTFNTDAAIA